MSQPQVEARSGVSQSQISRLENDALGKPPAEDVIRLAAAYGIEPNELAQKAGWWTPPAKYEPTDHRWNTVLSYLSWASDVEKEKFLDQLYDRVISLTEAKRLEGEEDVPPPKFHHGKLSERLRGNTAV